MPPTVWKWENRKREEAVRYIDWLVYALGGIYLCNDQPTTRVRFGLVAAMKPLSRIDLRPHWDHLTATQDLSWGWLGAVRLRRNAARRCASGKAWVKSTRWVKEKNREIRKGVKKLGEKWEKVISLWSPPSVADYVSGELGDAPILSKKMSDITRGREVPKHVPRFQSGQ